VTSTRTDRWVRLDGTTNMRDLGGLPTSDGGRTVPGRILRSDNLQTLTDDDVARLRTEFGLREVIDLRTTAEILLEGRGPLRNVEDVVHRHFSLLPERGHHTDVFAVEEDDPVAELSEGWVETLLPRQTAADDRGEPPAVRSYLGSLSDRPDHVVGALRAPPPTPGRLSCTARPARTAPGSSWPSPWRWPTSRTRRSSPTTP
jgi:protein-tyrosine phosphatase